MQLINVLSVLFKQHQITGYIIPSNDEYFNEYTPDSSKRLQYITNFSGSNGIAIICPTTSLFFTDGRYLEQSKRQLDGDIFQIFNIHELSDFPWEQYFGRDYRLGYDPKLFTIAKLNLFSKIKRHLAKISDNLVDQVWLDRESFASKVYLQEIEFAGQSYSDKISMCREILLKYTADSMLITSPDSICWLLNLRANDVPYTPLMLGKVIITTDKLYLFTNLEKIPKSVFNARADVTIVSEEEFTKVLNETSKILIDESFVSIHIMDLLKDKEIVKINDPCQLAKARKNNIEINHAINFHIQDAVALCEFFTHIFTIKDLSNFSEYELGEMLTEYRTKRDNYVMDSFHTICGFHENSAVIHYRAEKANSKRIIGNGLLLIDSGGQYKGSTTDVTRTFAIGNPTEEQKLRYTQVLKGHIALATIKFPRNVTGGNLDVLARQFLWRDHQDYPHGTGHGVGSFLSVHEGPQNISLRSNVPLEPGMILSNEPGFYKPGEFGIRIENLIYVRKSTEAHYLEFDNLTLVPYSKDLIDLKMLNNEEITYLKQYYQAISELVCPLLSSKAKDWVEQELGLVKDLG